MTTMTSTTQEAAGARSLPQRRGRSASEGADDRTLWHGLLNERSGALAEMYRRYGQSAYRVAYGVLRSAELAEDVTQEVFVRIWQRPDRFDPSRGSFGAFLKLDAHGRSVDLVRSERSRRDREIRDQQLAVSSESQVSLEEEVMKRISSERISSALELLHPDERMPIVLAYFQGLSYRGVAEALDAPEGTVKSRIRRGLGRLSELLDEQTPAFG